MGHYGQPAEPGDSLVQQFNPLAGSIGQLVRQAGDVATRTRQTSDQSGANRIPRDRKDDRYGGCSLLSHERVFVPAGKHNIHIEPNEFGHDLSSAFGATLRPSILDREGATLDPAEIAQTLQKD